MSPIRPKQQRLLPVTAAVMVGMLVIAYVYRDYLFASPQLLQGDPRDGRLTALINSHWWAPFQFSSNWRDLGLFFPVPSTLGYSDTFFATGVLTIPLGLLGVSYGVAFQLGLITLTGVGYASTVALMRIGPRAPWWLAITTGVFVSASSGMMHAGYHPQLLFIQLAPLSWLFLLLALRSRRPLTRLVCAFFSGFTLGLMLYSSFPTGWMLIVSSVVVAVILMGSSTVRSTLLRHPKSTVSVLAASVVGLTVWTIPTLATYLPTLLTAGDRSAKDYAPYILEPSELLNASRRTLWGLPFADQIREESGYGITALMGAAGIAALIAVVLLRKRRGAWPVMGGTLIVVGIITMLVPISWNGWSVWDSVYVVPGASSIRAVGRVALVASIFVPVGLGILVTTWTPMRGSARWLVAATFAVLLLEQVAPTTQLHTAAREEQLRQVSPPSYECPSFLLMSAASPDTNPDPLAVDAFTVARSLGIPTWNGYSGAIPKSFALWANDPDYWANAWWWQASYGLASPCGFDAATLTWVTPQAVQQRIDDERRRWLEENVESPNS